MYGLATQRVEGLLRVHIFVKCRECHVWARDIVDLQCCRMSSVSSHESQRHSCSLRVGSLAAEGAPRLMQGMEQAMDVQKADVQCDEELPNERVAHRAALQVVPTTPLAMLITVVVSWSEEQLLELATSLPAMRTIRHQPLGLRQRTCIILLKLLQHHTHCHHQWVKRRDSESLQAELAAARWSWLGPTLVVRAYCGGEHADDEGLTPGQRRKLSVELAGRRATLAEIGAWTELLRMYVRDLLSCGVFARGDGTHTLQQSTTLKAHTMRASDRTDSCNVRAALQILQMSVRALQIMQTAAEVHSLVAVEKDENEIARITMQCAANKQAAVKFSLPPAKLVNRMARGVVLAAEPGPSGWRNADIAANGRSDGGLAVLRDWVGTWTQAMVPHCTAKL